MSDNFWDLYEQEEQANRGGGGGYICQVEFLTGYKVFVSGMSNEDTFFAYAPGDAAGKDKALAAARNLGRAQYSFAFRVIKESVLGREVTWQGDRWEVYPGWTDDAKVVKARAKELGLTPGTFWMRFAWVPSPSGRTRKDSEEVDFVGMPVELYANQAEAQKAASEQAESFAGATENVEVPTWLVDHVKKEYETNTLPTVVFIGRLTESLSDANVSEAQVRAAAEQAGIELPL